jgi:hypothetical protein
MWTLPLALTLLFAAPAAAAEPTPQWVVVTAPAFRKALEPLVEQRKAQGFRVVILQTTDVLSAAEVAAGDAGKLRQRVHQLCREHRGPSCVLLVGSIDGDGLKEAGTKVLPPGRGTAGRMKGEPTDNAYGCPEGGRAPTVAVGRLPARGEAEARALVAKTLRFENDPRPDPWRRRLTVLAGIPAYNPLVDRLVERLAMARFERLSPVWSGRAIYTNPQSPFCVPDARLRAQALEYVQDGQAFLLYLGHSAPQGLYAGGAPFLNRDDFSRLRIARGGGVFLTFGCNGCQLAGRDGEGYGVAALRNPDGPCAAVGSHGICFAAMVQLAADGLFESTFTNGLPPRLGDTWLSLTRGLATGKIDALTFKMLDAVDGDDSIPQATQRQEHLEMFVLLGDPALRLPAVADDLELKADGPVAPGASLTVRGKVPARLAGARVRLTLERSVAGEPAGLEPLPQGLGRDRVLQANHEKANHFVLTEADATSHEGRFEARLTLPDKLPWRRLLLRAYAATDRAEALKVLPLEVRRPADRPRP